LGKKVKRTNEDNGLDNERDGSKDGGEPVDSQQTPYKVYHIDEVQGLWIIEDFISEREELDIVRLLDSDVTTPWRHSSFNGHCDSKVFGVRTQFGLPNEPRLVRKNDVGKGEHDIPSYLHPMIERLHDIAAVRKDLPMDVRTFTPNECNANSYFKLKKHYLKPHFDDRALSGPILVNLSLLGRAKMTYLKPQTTISVSVDLPPRCLQLITGPSRWDFMHCIKLEDVIDPRRVSITWRHSSSKVSGIQPLLKEQSIASRFQSVLSIIEPKPTPAVMEINDDD
jgi:alkylated DNA repair dioxygenase AlkB